MTTQMSQALKLARQSRQMRREALRTSRLNTIGRRDRHRLADQYWAKMLWTLGRVSQEAYLEWLKN